MRSSHTISAPLVGAQTGANSGFSIAVRGGLAVVGAPFDDLGAIDAGVVKVFYATTGALLYLLPNPEPNQEDYFGWSVAIAGTRIIVGAFSDDTAATSAGSAYMYDLSSATPALPVATLYNPTPAAKDVFGASRGHRRDAHSHRGLRRRHGSDGCQQRVCF